MLGELNIIGEIIVKRMIIRANTFLYDECGVTAIEYSVLASLIAIVIVLAVTGIGQSLQDTFEAVSAGF